ncbi:hypothetical protein AAZX31_01G212200 [Glycine max]
MMKNIVYKTLTYNFCLLRAPPTTVALLTWTIKALHQRNYNRWRETRKGPMLALGCQSINTDKRKSNRNLLDNASNLLTDLLSGGSIGSMPIAEGAVSHLFGRPLFFSLYMIGSWRILLNMMQHGAVYKLAFGPKAFVVVSDPIVARHILRENAFSYDKAVLADILEPIMGKGLIPADLDTWKQRRRVIALAFHNSYLEAMFNKLLEGEGYDGPNSIELDLEAEFSSLALDIIGIGVFNYDFGSVTKESPVIKCTSLLICTPEAQSLDFTLYGTLFEAEHRSTFYIPYWKIPLARWIIPRQRKFQDDLKVINTCLDGLIRNAKESRQETDVEKLQQRDYLNLKDASLLRFLVDVRGADVDDHQLRDDLMTMLIAGHETTAAVLTWAVFLLAQNSNKMKKAQAEVDLVLERLTKFITNWHIYMKDKHYKYLLNTLYAFRYIRLIVVEALRLYPQPPLLIRRSLKSDVLPGGHKGDKDGYAIPAGTDVFISVYNLHRSPYFWDRPHDFEPERFLVQNKNEEIEGWGGLDPSRSPGALYPNEVISDFAFLPFGGGPRKCVGDQFALMECTVALTLLLQNFDVELNRWN